MKYYEIATLKTVIFGAGAAAPALQAWLESPDSRGTLLGAFTPDIGGLNEIYLLRGFDSLDDMMQERDRALLSDNPMGCMEQLVDLRFESYKPFDFLPPVTSGRHGPVYEFRTYKARLDGIAPTIEKWREAIPKRSEYSPLSIALYGLDGSPRITQIWPYESLAARSEARGQSVKNGHWPPKGGPDFLTPDMDSSIAMPMAFSPMQ